MKKNDIIKETQNYVKKTLEDDCTGHDWWHSYRVWKTARHLAKKEGGNLFVIELSALLHDIADWKFNQGNLSTATELTSKWLNHLNVEETTVNKVNHIISSISFKGAGTNDSQLEIEGQIVQDADRLDAMGAIGIGRTFAYGGHKKRKMHDPAIKPLHHKTFESYQKNQGTTINHFHEKLFLIKNRMNTKTAKELAEEKHQLMEDFVTQFTKEWAADYE